MSVLSSMLLSLSAVAAAPVEQPHELVSVRKGQVLTSVIECEAPQGDKRFCTVAEHLLDEPNGPGAPCTVSMQVERVEYRFEQGAWLRSYVEGELTITDRLQCDVTGRVSRFDRVMVRFSDTPNAAPVSVAITFTKTKPSPLAMRCTSFDISR